MSTGVILSTVESQGEGRDSAMICIYSEAALARRSASDEGSGWIDGSGLRGAGGGGGASWFPMLPAAALRCIH